MKSALAVTLAVLFAASCAENECNFHSHCGDGFYCRAGGCFQDCRLDTDCNTGSHCTSIGQCEVGFRDASMPLDVSMMDISMADVPFDMWPFDAGRDTGPFDGGRDAGPTDTGPVDTGPVDTGPVDSGPDTFDAGPRLGRMESCVASSECASNLCVDGRCSISCTMSTQCADDEACGSDGLCHVRDVGVTCNAATPATCIQGLCLSSPALGGQCTEGCNSAADCPAGYGCSVFDGVGVCVEIERPCASPNDCASGLCLSVQGCTSTCRSAADCPLRATGLGLAPYTCERAFGSTDPICVPPEDVLGAERIGTSCSTVGTNDCRSGLCNADAPSGPMCIQSCTAQGGCPPGFGCKPEEISPGVIELFCARAGSGAIGDSCSAASQCASALCNAPGYCTRLCGDGICPAGMRCELVPTTSLRLCVR